MKFTFDAQEKRIAMMRRLVIEVLELILLLISAYYLIRGQWGSDGSQTPHHTETDQVEPTQLKTSLPKNTETA